MHPSKGAHEGSHGLNQAHCGSLLARRRFWWPEGENLILLVPLIITAAVIKNSDAEAWPL